MTKNPYAYAPLRRDIGAVRRPADALGRLACAKLLSRVERRDVEDIVDERWGDDGVMPILLKAASAPAMTTGAGWADTLAATSVSDFLTSMGPASAGALLLSRGLQFQFGPTANVVVPGILSAAANVGFVEQRKPIPVRELSTTAASLLSPRKFATIAGFAAEMLQYSTIESVVRVVLTESVALSLDAALLDATAADAVRPAGLRNGIAAIAESANVDLREACLEDLDSIISSVADVAGNNPIVVIAAPSRARRLKLRLANVADPGFEIMASSAVGAAEIVAVASNGLISAVDPVPRIETSFQGTLVMNSTAAELVTPGGAVGAPARSLWQADSVGLRLVLECNWGLRSSAALAWAEDVIW
jgi:Phage capsid family